MINMHKYVITFKKNFQVIKSLKFKESAAERLQLAIRLILIKISNQCLKKSKKKKNLLKKVMVSRANDLHLNTNDGRYAHTFGSYQ